MKIGTSMIVISENGNILLLKNTRTQHWELPGGKLEAHESILDAAIRELEEETGLCADELTVEFVGYYEHNSRPTYQNEDWCNMIFTTNETNCNGIATAQEDTHCDYGWFHPSQLPRSVWGASACCILKFMDIYR